MDELPTEVFDCDSCGSKVFGAVQADGSVKPESVDVPSLLRAHLANELAREEYQRQAETYEALYTEVKAALAALIVELREAQSPDKEQAKSAISEPVPH